MCVRVHVCAHARARVSVVCVCMRVCVLTAILFATSRLILTEMGLEVSLHTHTWSCVGYVEELGSPVEVHGEKLTRRGTDVEAHGEKSARCGKKFVLSSWAASQGPWWAKKLISTSR